MNVFEVIKERRSIRSYKEEDVEDGKLEKVLEAARWAPSWANTQCWRFVVVKNQETKEKLADSLNKNNPATDAIKIAPVIIIGCAKKGVSGYKKGEPVTEKGDWFMFDMGLAMQNLMLAAKELGLGTVQVGSFDAKKVKEILDVPENVAVVSMTPLGYPAREPSSPKRRELDKITFEETYGKQLT